MRDGDPDEPERLRRVEVYLRLREADPHRSIFGRPDSPPRRQLAATFALS